MIHFPSGYNRDPSGFKVRYLFPDAFYEGLKGWFGIKEAVLCAWGIMTDGCKILLHLDLILVSLVRVQPGALNF